MQRVAYLSPYSNPSNLYIERHKALLHAIGFEVKPFTLRLLGKTDGWRGIFNPHNVIVLHWLESRPFLNLQPGRNVQIKGLFVFIAYSCVLLIARARTIQFIHNHHVHDAPPKARKLSAQLTQLLAKTVKQRIVHDPASAALYNAQYLPHPLYREFDAEQQNFQSLRSTEQPATQSPSPLFGALGAIRPYKGIDELLKVWPAGARLLIAGSAKADTVAALNRIIAQRHLHDTITTDFKFLSQPEFNIYLDQIDVMVLPHTSESILVSGAFFESVGRVTALLVRRSSFSAWAQTQIPNIYLFDDDQSIPAMVAHIHANWPLQTSAATSQRAEELFGWNTCRNAYTDVIANSRAG